MNLVLRPPDLLMRFACSAPSPSTMSSPCSIKGFVCVDLNSQCATRDVLALYHIQSRSRCLQRLKRRGCHLHQLAGSDLLKLKMRLCVCDEVSQILLCAPCSLYFDVDGVNDLGRLREKGAPCCAAGAEEMSEVTPQPLTLLSGKAKGTSDRSFWRVSCLARYRPRFVPCLCRYSRSSRLNGVFVAVRWGRDLYCAH